MTIYLNKDEVVGLIEKRFGSVDNLVVEWEELVRTKKMGFGQARDRSSIYRWLDKGMPSSLDALFGFCGVLNIDPISILDFEKSGILKNFGKLRRSFQLGLKASSSYKALWEMFVPGPNWPSNTIAENYYGRPWHIVDFAHDSREITNVYALLNIMLPMRTEEFSPVVFHIAYRRKGALDAMWRPFGSIISVFNSTKLISESGDFQEMPMERAEEKVLVETFLGPGSVDFRLASLHRFDLQLDIPSTSTGVLRFHG